MKIICMELKLIYALKLMLHEFEKVADIIPDERAGELLKAYGFGIETIRELEKGIDPNEAAEAFKDKKWEER